MRPITIRTVLLALLGMLVSLQPRPAAADDIDIFLGTSGGTSVTPNIVFLLDNGPNWSRQSQAWCTTADSSTIPGCTSKNGAGVNQGQAEMEAILAVLKAQTTSVNIGIAMLTDEGGGAGACPPGLCGSYMRYGVRDITQTTNYTALANILNMVNANITSPNEKIQGQSHKDESAALYEVYKYFNGLAPHYGVVSTNGNADITGKNGYKDATYGYSTPYGQGLGSGFAYNSDGSLYNAPGNGAGCAKNYIIYIANNANNVGSAGAQTYETTSSGSPLPNLALDTAQNNQGWWTDEWTRYLFQQNITTYILDAYNAQNNADYSAVLQNAALVGGGSYYQVGTAAAVQLALVDILAKIQSVNSAFASASLPVNATNRSQDANQVFIGSFRPDPDAKPRWKGNLKQYELVMSGTNGVDLGDSLGKSAVNFNTGFVSDCAVSFWTKDSTITPPTPATGYWDGVDDTPAPKSGCPIVTTNPDSRSALEVDPPLPAGVSFPADYSDWPDGPIVEKGGVAETIRRGNNPPGTTTSPTYSPSTRKLLTISAATTSASSLVAFNSSNVTLPLPASNGDTAANVLTWAMGYDAYTTSSGTLLPEKPGDTASSSRPSLHGDVIHSRPQPINYNGSSTTGTTVFYGANDGMLRAVDASTGVERWAFVAPEFYGKFQRLYDNSPLVQYPTMPASAGGVSKDYFFDGLIGVYQNSDSSKVWIYPSMRRGGRMVYALDVTNPATPTFKWKFGCPNAGNDTGCVGGTNVTSMGQSWSAPSVATVKGYSTSTPVVIMGGGYDTCEDANSSSPSCSSPKGGIVYVLDADTGAVVQTFSTTRSVAADPALMTVHFDGTVDYAYIADTGGNVYRIDFIDTSGNALSKDNWLIHRVAYTNGGGRKFLFPPSEFPSFGGKGAYVAIGTGDREHPLQSQYPYTTPVQNRFYVFVDDLTVNNRAAVNLDDTNTGDTYYMGDYTNTNCTSTSTPSCASLNVVYATPTASTPDIQVGWFINLNAGTGEQTVTSSVIAGGAVAFSTNRPIPAAAGTCSTALGQARGYLLNLFNGSGEIGTSASQTTGGDRSTVLAGGGLPPSPVLVTTVVGGQTETVIIGAAQKSGGASTALSPQRVIPPINAKRRVIYWKSSGDNR